MPIFKYTVPLFTVDRTAELVPNAAQKDQQFEDPESQELFLQCLTPVWHRDIRVFTQRFEKYSNEAHLGWEIRSEFRGIPRLIQIRTF